ncbi:MAG: acyl carrier protein [Rhodospirillales bacterium]|jgi:acyl carrier protein|nr:acyl carrier protein [Rhodospirillales bacterium]
MADTPTLSALIEVFRDVFDDDTLVVNAATTANDIPDWDSQTHVHLVLAAEERFGVRFRTAEIEQLKHVGDFVALIERKMATTGA